MRGRLFLQVARGLRRRIAVHIDQLERHVGIAIQALERFPGHAEPLALRHKDRYIIAHHETRTRQTAPPGPPSRVPFAGDPEYPQARTGSWAKRHPNKANDMEFQRFLPGVATLSHAGPIGVPPTKSSRSEAWSARGPSPAPPVGAGAVAASPGSHGRATSLGRIPGEAGIGRGDRRRFAASRAWFTQLRSSPLARDPAEAGGPAVRSR